jgi:3-phenylpropionate/trans-cinnamate dioxygenase ferredoxin reductase subunit
VFAAGDVAEYDSVLHGRAVRIEHEDVAAAQGRLAARNMVDGSDEPFTEVPYFWSDLADWLSLEYVGLGSAWDETQITDAAGDRCYAVRYLRDGELVGVCSVGGAADLDEIRAEISSSSAATQLS